MGTNAGGCDKGLRLGATKNCLITNNVFSGFDFYGIALESTSTDNRLDRNVVNDNLRWGIWFTNGSTNNVYGRNSATANQNLSTCSPDSGACLAPGVCDNDGGNLSSGDNLVPGAC